MLQYITIDNDCHSIPEQAQMAIEGGCRWIQLSTSATGEELKEIALELMALCRENDVFLVIDHNVELTNELKVHGVHLSPGDMLPAEAREFLGPHAVIGVTVTTAAEIITLKKADIDYVQIGPFPQISPEQYRRIVTETRQAGVTTPIVATGNITVDDLADLMASGISGVAMSKSIADSPDMVAYTSKCIDTLNRI